MTPTILKLFEYEILNHFNLVVWSQLWTVSQKFHIRALSKGEKANFDSDIPFRFVL